MSAFPSPFVGAAILLGYAFLSNVAIAVVPHEPVVVWYGARLGIAATALIATAGTALAAWTDHRLLASRLGRLSHAGGTVPSFALRWFGRAPFAILAVSGITPLPLFPFKLLAFAAHYPRGRYIAAIAAGRLPRYVLLAWLGVALPLPAWVLALAGILLLIPIARTFRCATPNAN